MTSYEARLYVGNREGYDGPEFGRERLLGAIRDFHRDHPGDVACLRVTPCCYVCKDYQEEGWEVACISYPRFPKSPAEIREMMLALAGHLLAALKQNRVGVVATDETFLLTAADAEEHPAVHRTENGEVA